MRESRVLAWKAAKNIKRTQKLENHDTDDAKSKHLWSKQLPPKFIQPYVKKSFVFLRQWTWNLYYHTNHATDCKPLSF